MWRWLFIWLFLISIEIISVPLFTDSAQIENNIIDEFRQTTRWMSSTEVANIYSEANVVFRKLFMESGIAQASYAMVVPDEGNRTNDRDEIKPAKEMVGWFDEKIVTWWAMWLQAIERLVLFMHWLPYAMVILIPACIDGWIQREIKKTNFGYASPIRYHLGMFLIFGLVLLPLAFSFLPFAVSPLFAPVWSVVSALALVILTSNLQKTI